VTALTLFLKGVPWQVWAALVVVVTLLAFGQYRYNEGWADAVTEQRKQQAAAKDAAGKEVDRLRDGDRSRVLQFDRD